MKIYFCEICNESIPLADINEGRARSIKGKMICSKCMPSPEPGGAALPVANPSGAAPSGAFLVLAIVALLLSAGAGAFAAFGYWSLLRVEGERREALKGALGRVASLSRDLEDETTERRALERDATRSSSSLESGLAAIEGKVDKLERTYLEDKRTWSTRAEVDQRITDALAPLLAKIDPQLQKVITGLDAMRTQLAALKARADKVEGDLGKLSSAPVPEAGGEPVPERGSKADLSPFPPEVRALLKKLDSPDVSEHWAALTELGKSNDPRIVPFVLDSLNNSDAFVRHAAVMLLGELGSPLAIGALIERLGDEEAFVRDGAYVALRKLTKQNIKFDAHASAEQVRKQREAWARWWKENRASFEKKG